MLLTQIKLNKNYKGQVCASCKQPITVGSKTGFCKKHTPKKPRTLEFRKKISIALLGNQRAKGTKRSLSTRNLISINNGRWNKGKQLTEAHKEKLRIAKLNERHPNWQGGKTSENKRIRATSKYKEWRLNVFIRDNYTCLMCGIRGTKLQADHIKPFAFYKNSRFELENGRTLCIECHKKTDNYFWKANKKTYRVAHTQTESNSSE